MAALWRFMAVFLAWVYVDVTTSRTCKCTVEHNIQYIDCENLGLKHIPELDCFNKTLLTRLNFARNDLGLVDNRTFHNVTMARIMKLDLQYNNIRNISRDAFVPLEYLAVLVLSGNHDIQTRDLEEAFTGINFKWFVSLELKKLRLKLIPDTFFRAFENAKKINITLASNEFGSFPFRAFEKMPGVYHLDFGNNNISSLHLPANVSINVRRLDLDNNQFDALPKLCKNDTLSFFPELQRLNFQFNFMRTIDSYNYRCLDKLVRFHLNGNIIRKLYSNMFSGLKSIDRITLSETFGLVEIDNFPFNNTNLKRVFFRKNSLYTENPKHSLKMFEGCSALELLNMANNALDKTTDSQFQQLLMPVKKTLKILIMGGCKLNRIPKMFLNLEALEELVLYDNRIASWPDGRLDSLTRLNTIYMAGNEITTISQRSFPPSLQNNSLYIDISVNPFHCTCDLRWFIEWMKSDPSKFDVPKWSTTIRSYICTTPTSYKGRLLISIPLSDSYCVLDQNSKIITLVLTSIMIVILVVSSFAYRFRWHIRYCMYIIRYQKRTHVDTRTYEYDVFVTYSVEDRHWVIDTLMPVLENQASLKMCIHDRDFEVGKLIVDNIVDSVQSSRSLLIILSNTFAQSPWCQFELNLIQRHVLENEQNLLVVVMLEDIDTRYVTKAMRVMLQTTTYLLWGEDGYAKKAFFNRLRMLLRQNDRMSSRRISV